MKDIQPYLETNSFVEEVANLKMKQLPNGNMTLEKVVKKIDKDRVSSTMYVLWYINEFANMRVDDDYGFSIFVN